MKGRLTRAARRVGTKRGSPAAPASGLEQTLSTLTPEDRGIVERALPDTMTGVARLVALVDAVRYCVRAGVEGDFAECGVWRGGSVIAMVDTLQALGVTDRDIHLYDTFEGMTEPTEHDVSTFAPPAITEWRDAAERSERPWPGLFGEAAFSEEQVRRAVLATGYPEHRFHFVRGRVEDTLPLHSPDRIALLRLDTDWYESTRVELEILYPRLVDGGVLIIDDYGHWDGCRRAVDEYFTVHPAPLLTRVDYTCRLAVKR